jgi:hypothetical protein
MGSSSSQRYQKDMTIYLVYGLAVDGASDQPYVKKAFARKYDADKYCRELSKKWHLGKSYVEAITLERPPNLD